MWAAVHSADVGCVKSGKGEVEECADQEVHFLLARLLLFGSGVAFAVAAPVTFSLPLLARGLDCCLVTLLFGSAITLPFALLWRADLVMFHWATLAADLVDGPMMPNVLAHNVKF